MRLVCELLRAGEEKKRVEAQGLLDACGVTVPTGDLVEGAYDERGHLYAMPGWVVGEPAVVVDDIDEEAAGDGVEDGGNGEERSRDKGKEVVGAKEGEETVKVRCRLSDRGGPDMVVSVGKEESVRVLVRKLEEAVKVGFYNTVQGF